MLPNEEKPRNRKIRVERPVQLHMEMGEDHSWAVSYSDLLMVILSFFVVFFSQSDEKTDSIIQSIVEDMATGKTSGGASNTPGHPDNKGRFPGSIAATDQKPADEKELRTHLDKIAVSLKNLEVSSVKRANSIMFLFPENMYQKNGYMLNTKNQNKIKFLIRELAPYLEHIDMVFVGHSDSRPVRNPTEYVQVQNNFDLSSLRANYALRYALSQGVPKNRLFTYGAAENKRNSRSLSLVIRPKGGPL